MAAVASTLASMQLVQPNWADRLSHKETSSQIELKVITWLQRQILALAPSSKFKFRTCPQVKPLQWSLLTENSSSCTKTIWMLERDTENWRVIGSADLTTPRNRTTRIYRSWKISRDRPSLYLLKWRTKLGIQFRKVLMWSDDAWLSCIRLTWSRNSDIMNGIWMNRKNYWSRMSGCWKSS